MTPERIDEILARYRSDTGRCGCLEMQIRELETAIQRARANLVEDLASVRSQEITDMPKGTATGNPTEKVRILLASGWVTGEIHEMEAQLALLREEYGQRSFGVLYIDNCLKGLSPKERWIVENQVIDGEYWKEVVAKFKADFHEDTSKDSLKRLKQRALDKIYRMAE